MLECSISCPTPDQAIESRSLRAGALCPPGRLPPWGFRVRCLGFMIVDLASDLPDRFPTREDVLGRITEVQEREEGLTNWFESPAPPRTRSNRPFVSCPGGIRRDEERERGRSAHRRRRAAASLRAFHPETVILRRRVRDLADGGPCADQARPRGRLLEPTGGELMRPGASRGRWPRTSTRIRALRAIARRIRA